MRENCLYIEQREQWATRCISYLVRLMVLIFSVLSTEIELQHAVIEHIVECSWIRVKYNVFFLSLKSNKYIKLTV